MLSFLQTSADRTIWKQIKQDNVAMKINSSGPTVCVKKTYYERRNNYWIFIRIRSIYFKTSKNFCVLKFEKLSSFEKKWILPQAELKWFNVIFFVGRTKQKLSELHTATQIKLFSKKKQ